MSLSSNFEKRKNWYKTVVFKGKTLLKSIQYGAQHALYAKVFQKVKIYISKVTRKNRKSSLDMISQ
ncbi:hypothetical protein CLU79DRAFT_712152 [Phycomyces nitens]|nr:hypothetical protein CLU79DRAFT_712152 [Phycomyces nitens]